MTNSICGDELQMGVAVCVVSVYDKCKQAMCTHEELLTSFLFVPCPLPWISSGIPLAGTLCAVFQLGSNCSPFSKMYLTTDFSLQSITGKICIFESDVFPNTKPTSCIHHIQ